MQQGEQRSPAPRRRTDRCASGRRGCVTSTVIIAMPRSAIVSVGTPGRTLPMSPITIASAANRSGPRGREGAERAADLLHALDHDLDPRRAACPPTRAAHRRASGCSTSCPPCRARRWRRRARSPRTAATPTSTRRRSARRRSGCTAEPSGRPAGAGISPITTGAVSGQLERIQDRDARVAAELADRLVRLEQRRPGRLGIARRRDRRDRHQPRQVRLQLRHQGGHALDRRHAATLQVHLAERPTRQHDHSGRATAGTAPRSGTRCR